jgi:ribosomal protein L7Ae-like RNA K-turn-binding protein
MAKKAGLLAVGGDATAAAARNCEAKLIITACDASEVSVRRARISAETYGIKHIPVPYTMFELGKFAGHGSPGTIAFLSKGLAEGFQKRLTKDTVEKPAVVEREGE